VRDRIERFGARLAGRLPAALQLRLSGTRQIRLDGQVLDPGVQFALRALALRGYPTLVGPPGGDPEPAAVRARVHREALVFAPVRTEVGSVRELELAGADGPLRARHYAPPASGPPGPRPLLVFFHGGAWVIGDLDTHDEPCRLLCRHADVQVLSVDYRLAPEHPFPAAVDDAVAAFTWAVEHAAELGADPGRVAVGGDSAGGNLSAVVAQTTARNGGPSPALQVLIYPGTDLREVSTASGRMFAAGFFLTDNDRRWGVRHYFSGTDTDRSDPRASPALARDLSGLAPAVVLTAAFDPLRDEGEAYAAALRDAGTPVVLHRAPGLIHGFLNMTTIPAARDAALQLAGMVRAGLALAP
jgi:acetyl esterase